MTGPRALGLSKVAIPAMGFGGGAIGNLYRPVTDKAARRAVETALRLGITYFDTAPHYGFGLSEERIGAVLAEHDPGERIIVSTKVGRLLEPVAAGAPRERQGFVDAAPFNSVFDYSYDAVMRSFEASRARLRRERIDILFGHDLGEVTHGEDHERRFAEFMSGGYRALRSLRDGGAVGAIGLGANEWRVCARAMAEGEFDVMLLAGRYTLLEAEPLETFLPECARRDVSVIVGGPYNSGILASGTRGAPLHYDYATPEAEIVERVRRIEAVCDSHGVPLAAAALQFPLGHRQVASVIPGMASADEVAQSIAWMAADIPAEFWADLKTQGLLHPDAPEPR